LPDPVAAASTAKLGKDLRAEHGLTGRVRSPELLHLSLNGVGEFDALPAQIVSDAMKAGSAVTAAPFEVVFDRVMSFSGGEVRPLVLRCGDGLVALTAMYRALGAEMAKIGFRSRVAWPFTPHVTVLYDRNTVPLLPLEHPVRWKVRDFVLVHSLHGERRHLHLARWPLHG
jgi:2'-5' RNA ligase